MCSYSPLDLHSFPTRRSSDLVCLPLQSNNRTQPFRHALIDVVRLQFRRKRSGIHAEKRYPAGKRVGERFEKDRKSTRLNSSHEWNTYSVFCLKKKKQ